MIKILFRLFLNLEVQPNSSMSKSNWGMNILLRPTLNNYIGFCKLVIIFIDRIWTRKAKRALGQQPRW